jgi:hypothetical protein
MSRRDDDWDDEPRSPKKGSSGGGMPAGPMIFLGGGFVLVVGLLAGFLVYRVTRPSAPRGPDPGGQAGVNPPPRAHREEKDGGKVVNPPRDGVAPKDGGKVANPKPQPVRPLTLNRQPWQPGKGLDGKIIVADWVVQCFAGSGWTDYPMEKMTHALRGDVLELTNDTGIHDHAGIATRAYFEGDYVIKAEVQNGKSVGLKSPADDSAWAGVYLQGGWSTVVITRRQGVVSISVNGAAVRLLESNSKNLDRALFYFHVNADATAGIRSFEASR